MRNKKAMSEIVITVIMVVLALVAVAVIWQIVINLIGDKGEQIGSTQKCMEMSMNIQSAYCGAESCTVTMRRGADKGGTYGGLKVVFRNSQESSQVFDSNDFVDFRILQPLESKSFIVDIVDIGIDPVLTVEATVYFLDENSGKEQLCPQPSTYGF